MLDHLSEEGFKNKRIAISGSGNVAQYAALKVLELGGKVVSLSDSKGSLICTSQSGTFSAKEIEKIAALKVSRKSLGDETFEGDFKHIDGVRPWTQFKDIHIALPCATQNEVSKEEAEALIASGVRIIAEGSNMGCTNEAIAVFENHRRKHGREGAWYAPGKASNAGGVAVSGLEMAQNSGRIKWTKEDVDEKLKGIMKNIYVEGLAHAKRYGKDGDSGHNGLPSLVLGSNIAGFVKVAAAMKDQGDWW